MNLQNKILMTLFALGVISGSCDSLIYDNLEHCPQGVFVKFYSMTPCDVDSTYVGSVPFLTVFAFDNNDVLAAQVIQSNVTLSKGYEVLLPVSNGDYTFIAWAGIDNNFTLGAFSQGITTKKDVMLTLKNANNRAANLQNTQIWQGESGVVNLPDPLVYGTVYKHTSINLLEVTNRIKVIVEIEPNVRGVLLEDLEIDLTSANGVLYINGAMPLNNQALSYPIQNKVLTDNSVSWDFTLMDLVKGYKNNVVITNKKTGNELFNGEIIENILLNTINGAINLDCENDFVIKFIIKDDCPDCEPETNFSVSISVNGWQVHSYETTPGGGY